MTSLLARASATILLLLAIPAPASPRFVGARHRADGWPNVAVYGGNVVDPGAVALATRVGRVLAARNFSITTGACRGVAEHAAAGHAETVGWGQRYGVTAVAGPEGFAGPTAGLIRNLHTVVVTAWADRFGMPGLIARSTKLGDLGKDGAVFVSGLMGTPSEFGVAAYRPTAGAPDERRATPMAALRGSGGFSSALQDIAPGMVGLDAKDISYVDTPEQAVDFIQRRGRVLAARLERPVGRTSADVVALTRRLSPLQKREPRQGVLRVAVLGGDAKPGEVAELAAALKAMGRPVEVVVPALDGPTAVTARSVIKAFADSQVGVTAVSPAESLDQHLRLGYPALQSRLETTGVGQGRQELNVYAHMANHVDLAVVVGGVSAADLFGVLALGMNPNLPIVMAPSPRLEPLRQVLALGAAGNKRPDAPIVASWDPRTVARLPEAPGVGVLLEEGVKLSEARKAAPQTSTFLAVGGKAAAANVAER